MTEVVKPIRRRPVASVDDIVEAYNREAVPALYQIRELLLDRAGSIESVSESATMALSEQVYFVDATDGAVTITLPAADESSMRLSIKKIDSSANAVTVAAAGSDTIDGAATKSLASQYDAVEVVSDGSSAWYEL